MNQMKKLKEIDDMLSQLYKESAPYELQIAALRMQRKDIVKRMNKITWANKWRLFKLRVACWIVYHISQSIDLSDSPYMRKAAGHIHDARNLLSDAIWEFRDGVQKQNMQHEGYIDSNEELITSLLSYGWHQNTPGFITHALGNESEISISLPEPDDDICILTVGAMTTWEPIIMKKFEDAVKIAQLIINNVEDLTIPDVDPNDYEWAG